MMQRRSRASYRSALEEIADIVDRDFTPEEKSAFAAFLVEQKTARAPGVSSKRC